jgi:hypothetical protein
VIINTMNAAMIPTNSLIDCVAFAGADHPAGELDLQAGAACRPRDPLQRRFVEAFNLSTDTAKCRSANAIRPSLDTVAVFANPEAPTVRGTRSASATVGASRPR